MDLANYFVLESRSHKKTAHLNRIKEAELKKGSDLSPKFHLMKIVHAHSARSGVREISD